MADGRAMTAGLLRDVDAIDAGDVEELSSLFASDPARRLRLQHYSSEKVGRGPRTVTLLLGAEGLARDGGLGCRYGLATMCAACGTTPAIIVKRVEEVVQ